MKKYIHDLKIVDNKRLSESYYILELSNHNPLPEILPGQFAEVNISGTDKVFLRRPLSIHDVDYNKNTLSFLVQIVGNGTRHLANIEIGQTLNVVYPLGKGFKLIKPKEKALLIGGGCGVAPLLYLARHLKEIGVEVNILIGVRSMEQLIEVEKYKQYDQKMSLKKDLF